MVKQITIVRDMQTGISKGYAYVKMLDQTGADRAIRVLHGITMGDRTMSVRLMEDKAFQVPVVEKSSGPYPRLRTQTN